MPYTKRFPIHGKPDNVLEYITNEEKINLNNYSNDFLENLGREFSYIAKENKTWETKTNGEKGQRFCTGINCNWETAKENMYLLSKKYGNEKDNIQAYHTIQSFSWEDVLTPKQVHEMGVELAKKLYPNFQCVVTTHCDRGHLHNHIVCNATSLDGKKLRDDFYKSDTSLMKLREISDTIASRYGCKIIKEAPLIGKENAKQEYMEYLSVNWNEKMKTEIEELKHLCSSFDDMLRYLSIRGYEIKNGKHIAIRGFGMERFRRLDTLGKGFTQKELKAFFARKNSNYITEEELNSYITKNMSPLGKILTEKREDNKEAIRMTQKVLDSERPYPKYKSVREQALEEIRMLNEQLKLLNQYNIQSYQDLSKNVLSLQEELNESDKEIQKIQKELYEQKQEREACSLFLQYYNIHATETDESIPKDQQVLSPTSKLWEQINMEFGCPSLNEVRKKYNSYVEKEIELARKIAENSYKRYELSNLYKMQMSSLEQNEQFIPSFEFTENQICESPHSEEVKKEKEGYMYIRIPYTNLYTYILKETTVTNKYGRKQYYVIPDDTYTLYDEKGNEIHDVFADELADIVKVQKENTMKMYSKTEDLKKDGKIFVFTVDSKMFDKEHETATSYRIRIPYSQCYVDIPKDTTVWIKENKTCQITLHKKTFICQYNEQNIFEKYVEVQELEKDFEQRKKEFQNRN